MVVFSIFLAIYSIHGFVDLTRQANTRTVADKMAKAFRELENSRPSQERAERFLKRLKEIDPGYAPAELKQALQDYIHALEKGMTAIKAGEDSVDYASQMADAKERLIKCVRKYD